MNERKEKIEEFLKTLGTADGLFFIMCGKCGTTEKMDEYGGDTVLQEISGVFSEYTGHLWDNVNIKCTKCGNAISFTKY